MIRSVLDDILEFLSNFSWVYDFKWTEIYNLKQWKQLPILWIRFFENLDFEDMKKLVLCDFSFQNVPEDIQQYFLFYQKISDLIEPLKLEINTDCSANNFKKINPKKFHEISKINAFIKEYNEKSELNIIDIGSGLGHLARCLENNLKNNDYKVSILAVEGNEDLHARNNSNINVQKLNYFITEENLREFSCKINEVFQRTDIITGLHCCGNLSCLILKFYATISNADSLLLFSCCYHRMFQKELTGFPLSEIYKTKHSEHSMGFVTPVFLRLGCQERKETWLEWSNDDYYHHQYTVAFRCALESFLADTREENLSKLKRIKFNRKNASKMSFNDFILFHLPNLPVEDGAQFVKEIDEQNSCSHWYSVMLALQVSIQEIVEYFILLDRVLFLKEFPLIKTVKLIKIFDPSISPRNIAIYASKF